MKIPNPFKQDQGFYEKREALQFLSINDLKGIIAYYGIGNPPEYETPPFAKDRLKIDLTRKHYVDRIVDSLSIKQINNYIDLKKSGGVK